MAKIPGLVSTDSDNNPYMDGQKLPVAAKKGIFWTPQKDDRRSFLLLHFETFQLPTKAKSLSIIEKRAVSDFEMFEPSYDNFEKVLQHLSVKKQIIIQTENTWTTSLQH